MNTAENRAHWDERAKLGETAGTQDLILKELEQRAILEALGDDRHLDVLEVGCGRGETVRLVSQRIRLMVDAIDSSPEMIAAAQKGAPTDVEFMVADVMDIPRDLRDYDVIYSQRCLINLPSWDAQEQAIDAIAERLFTGGRFLMCEHSQNGVNAINEARQALGLTAIEPPWHNRYFRDEELATITSLALLRCVPFSATYYFLSRVLNAKLSADQGKAPEYDAPINQLALTLPADYVDAALAQGRLWIWEKP
jgi:SAM-dependent methyltransferase